MALKNSSQRAVRDKALGSRAYLAAAELGRDAAPRFRSATFVARRVFCATMPEILDFT
jgi:hypothetical protein